MNKPLIEERNEKLEEQYSYHEIDSIYNFGYQSKDLKLFITTETEETWGNTKTDFKIIHKGIIYNYDNGRLVLENDKGSFVCNDLFGQVLNPEIKRTDKITTGKDAEFSLKEIVKSLSRAIKWTAYQQFIPEELYRKPAGTLFGLAHESTFESTTQMYLERIKHILDVGNISLSPESNVEDLISMNDGEPFVIIDQTNEFDTKLKAYIASNEIVSKNNGDSFTINRGKNWVSKSMSAIRQDDGTYIALQRSHIDDEWLVSHLKLKDNLNPSNLHILDALLRNAEVIKGKIYYKDTVETESYFHDLHYHLIKNISKPNSESILEIIEKLKKVVQSIQHSGLLLEVSV